MIPQAIDIAGCKREVEAAANTLASRQRTLKDDTKQLEDNEASERSYNTQIQQIEAKRATLLADDKTLTARQDALASEIKSLSGLVVRTVFLVST